MAEENVDVTVNTPNPDSGSRESELLEKLFDERLQNVREEMWQHLQDRANSEWRYLERIDELESRILELEAQNAAFAAWVADMDDDTTEETGDDTGSSPGDTTGETGPSTVEKPGATETSTTETSTTETTENTETQNKEDKTHATENNTGRKRRRTAGLFR